MPSPPPTTRDDHIARLQTFQHLDLFPLRERLSRLDAAISLQEARVLHAANLVSAARGLVAMRGACVARPDAPASSRARPKQRLSRRRDGSLVRHPAAPAAPLPTLRVAPAGVVYTAFRKRFEAPRQSFTGAAARATILLPPCRPPAAQQAFLRALRPGMRLWVVYWFDRNAGLWRHFVRPPRARGGWRVGLFATRSPNRPTPVGLSLSVVDAVDVVASQIVVSGVDILDETPLIGIKIYDSESEAHPQARSGWLDDVHSLQPLYYDPVDRDGREEAHIVFDEDVAAKLAFIDARSAVDVRFMVAESLKRRVRTEDVREDALETDICSTGSLPVGSFRIVYRVEQDPYKILVTNVVSGMRNAVCEAEAETDPEARLHLEFQRTYTQQVSFGDPPDSE